jgi:hypothetical protein
LTDGAVAKLRRSRSEPVPRGYRFDDEQSGLLLRHLGPLAAAQQAAVGDWLDWIRSFYLSSVSYRLRTPSRADQNEALEVLHAILVEFLSATKALDPAPEWNLDRGDGGGANRWVPDDRIGMPVSVGGGPRERFSYY